MNLNNIIQKTHSDLSDVTQIAVAIEIKPIYEGKGNHK